MLAIGCMAQPIAFAQADPPPAPRYGLAHRSVFEQYTPHAPAPIQAWRDSNQRVHEIGGWRAYLRSVQPEPGSPPPLPPAVPALVPATPAEGPAGAPAGPQGHSPADHRHHGAGGKP